MNLAIRVFALGLVLAGAAAANSMPKNAPFISHQAPSASAPRPACNPGTDGCGFVGQ